MMLRILKTVGVVIAGLAASAHAANSPLVVWQGAVTITSLSDQCSVGYSVGDLATSVYRPRLNPDEPPSALTMLSSRSAVVFFNASGANDQMIGRGTFNGHYIGSRATTIPNSSQSSFTGNYNFKVKPSAIAADTTSITINGSVTNFFNQTGCTVSFMGAYQPRGN